MNRRTVGFKNWSALFGQKDKTFAPAWNQTTIPQLPSTVIVTTLTGGISDLQNYLFILQENNLEVVNIWKQIETNLSNALRWLIIAEHPLILEERNLLEKMEEFK